MPFEKYATHRPSGEKNGPRAFCVPARATGSSSSSLRLNSWLPVVVELTYTIREPSGDNATVGPAENSASGAPGGNASVKRATGRALRSGRGRSVTQSARPVASPAIAQGATSRRASRPTCLGADAAPGRASASANCAAVWNRSARSLASAFTTAASTWGGTDSRSCRSGRGRSVTTFAITDWTVGPVIGGSPASISYRTVASE